MSRQQESSSRQSYFLPAILAIALAVRLGYLLYYSSMPDWGQLTVDNYYHLNWAQRIAAGDILGDTTYFRAPLYVYCLAMVNAVFGDSLWAMRLFGAAVGVAAVAMTYLLARRLFGTTVALIAGLLLSIYPTAVYFDGELLLDPLFTLLTLVAVYRLVMWRETHTSRNAILTGLVIGLAAITRPTALVFVPLLIGWILLWRTDLRTRAIATLFLVLGVALPVGPVTVRNMLVAEDPVLIASQSGINLYIGNNESADGVSAGMPQPYGLNWKIQDISYVAEVKSNRQLTPSEVSDYWSGRAFEWMRSHPFDFLSLYLRKVYFSIANREISNNRDMADFFSRVPFLKYHPLQFAVILAFGVIGALLSWRASGRPGALLVIFVTVLIAANSLFFVNSRFRLPGIPVLCILTSVAVLWLRDAWLRHRRGFALSLVGICGIALFSILPVLRLPSGVAVGHLASRALYLYNTGQYNESLPLFHQILQLDPQFPETNLNLGAAFFRLGKGDSARFYFERERALHPGRPKAYTNLASFHLVNSQYDSVYIPLQRALVLRPYDLTANLVLLRAVAKDPSTSVEDVRNVIAGTLDRTDSNITVMQEAAQTAYARGLDADGESLLRISLVAPPPPIETDDAAFEPNFPYSPHRLQQFAARSHYLLGFQYGRSGRFRESLVESQSAIESDPTLAEAYVNLASGYLSLGEPSRADSVVSSALTKFPAHPQLQQLRQTLRK